MQVWPGCKTTGAESERPHARNNSTARSHGCGENDMSRAAQADSHGTMRRIYNASFDCTGIAHAVFIQIKLPGTGLLGWTSVKKTNPAIQRMGDKVKMTEENKFTPHATVLLPRIPPPFSKIQRKTRFFLQTDIPEKNDMWVCLSELTFRAGVGSAQTWRLRHWDLGATALDGGWLDFGQTGRYPWEEGGVTLVGWV